MSQGVDEQMCHVLGAGTQLKNGKNLSAGVDGEPEPQHLCGAAEPRAQLVQLQVRKVEVTEAVLVQRLCMFASTSQPGGDGGLAVAEDPLGGGWVEPFSEAESTMAIWCVGVFRRYRAVLRLEVKVVRQA